MDPARRRELLGIRGATGNEDGMFRRETAAKATVIEPAETQADLLAESLPAYGPPIFQEHASLIPEQESEPETASDVSSALVPESALPELEVATPTQDAPLRDISGDWLSSMPGAFPGLSLSPEEEASSEAGREAGIEQEDQEASRAPTPAPESTSAEEEAVQTSRDQEPSERSPTLAPSQDPKDSFEPSEPEVAPSDALPAEVEPENPTQLSGSENPAGTTPSDDGTFEAPKTTEDVFDETAENFKSQTATPTGDDADIMSGGPSYDRQPGTATPEAEAEESPGSSRVNASFGTTIKEDKKVHFAGDDNLQQPVAEAENEQASIKDSSNDVVNEGTAGQLPTLESASPRKRKTSGDDTSSNNVVIVGSVDGSMIDAALSPRRQKQKHISPNQGIDEHETQPADSPTESSTSEVSTQTQLPQHAADLREKERVSARRQKRGTTQFRESPRGSRFSPLRTSPPRSGRRGPSKSDVESHEINELMNARIWSVYRGPCESENDLDEAYSEAHDAVRLDLGDLEPDHKYHKNNPAFDTDVHEITLDLKKTTVRDVVHNGGDNDVLNAPHDTDILNATPEKAGHDASTVRPRLVEPLDRDGNEPMSDPVDGDDDNITQPGVGGASPFNSAPQHQDVQVADQGAVADASGDVDMDEDQASVPSNSRSDIVNHQAPSPFTNPQAGGFPTMPNNAFAPAASNAFTPRSNPFASASNAPISNPFTPSPNPFAPTSNAFTPSPTPFAPASNAPASNAFTSVSNSSVLGSQPPANPFQAPSATQLSASNQPPSQAGPKLRPLAAGKGEQPKQALTVAPKRNVPTPLPGLSSLAQQPTFSGSQPPMSGPNFFSSLASAPPSTRFQPLPAGSGVQPTTHAGAGAPKRNNGTPLPGLSLVAQGLQQPSSGGIQPQMNNGASFNTTTTSAPQQQQQQPTFSGTQPPRRGVRPFGGIDFRSPGMNQTPPFNANTAQAPAANTTDQATQPQTDLPSTTRTVVETPKKPTVQESQSEFPTAPKSNTFPPGSKSANAPANQNKASPAYQTAMPSQPPTERLGTFKTKYKGSPGNELYDENKDAAQAGKMIHDWLAHALAEGKRLMKESDSDAASLRKELAEETSGLSIVMKQMKWAADLLQNGRSDWNLAREWSNEWFAKAGGASNPLVRLYIDLGKAKKCGDKFKKLLEHLNLIHERLTMLHGSK